MRIFILLNNEIAVIQTADESTGNNCLENTPSGRITDANLFNGLRNDDLMSTLCLPYTDLKNGGGDATVTIERKRSIEVVKALHKVTALEIGEKLLNDIKCDLKLPPSGTEYHTAEQKQQQQQQQQHQQQQHQQQQQQQQQQPITTIEQHNNDVSFLPTTDFEAAENVTCQSIAHLTTQNDDSIDSVNNVAASTYTEKDLLLLPLSSEQDNANSIGSCIHNIEHTDDDFGQSTGDDDHGIESIQGIQDSHYWTGASFGKLCDSGIHLDDDAVDHGASTRPSATTGDNLDEINSNYASEVNSPTEDLQRDQLVPVKSKRLNELLMNKSAAKLDNAGTSGLLTTMENKNQWISEKIMSKENENGKELGDVERLSSDQSMATEPVPNDRRCACDETTDVSLLFTANLTQPLANSNGPEGVKDSIFLGNKASVTDSTIVENETFRSFGMSTVVVAHRIPQFEAVSTDVASTQQLDQQSAKAGHDFIEHEQHKQLQLQRLQQSSTSAAFELDVSYEDPCWLCSQQTNQCSASYQLIKSREHVEAVDNNKLLESLRSDNKLQWHDLEDKGKNLNENTVSYEMGEIDQMLTNARAFLNHREDDDIETLLQPLTSHNNSDDEMPNTLELEISNTSYQNKFANYYVDKNFISQANQV